MVALLKDNGEFQPMPVVCDTAKFEQLKSKVEAAGQPVPGLIELIRQSQKDFGLFTK
nr:hypothetical protein [Brucella intermedia]